MVGEAETARSQTAETSLPPITQLTVASMILVIIGGIYLAGHLPTIPPLAPAVATLAAAAVILLVDVIVLSRIPAFAWHTFFLVARWALLAYAVIAGLLAYVFISDGTRGSVLVVLVLSLLVYAVDVPLILAFSVARHQRPE